MSITVSVPTALRKECNGLAQISLSAATVRSVLDQLRRDHPSLYRSVCDETGAVRRHVNVFVNDSNVRDLDGFDTRLGRDDVITIAQAVSGG